MLREGRQGVRIIQFERLADQRIAMADQLSLIRSRIQSEQSLNRSPDPRGDLMSQAHVTRSPVVFLLDVDNTLLNNDRVSEDLRSHLTREVGAQGQQRYWAIFEEL